MDQKLERLREMTDFFSHKWEPQILYVVSEVGEANFTKLKSAIDGISEKMLSEGLNDLCERGFLTSVTSETDKRRKIYRVTQEGHGLVMVLSAFCNWHAKYQSDDTVLIIEDETMVADLLRGYIGSSYSVRHESSGEQGIEAVDEGVDLVILDRRLPDTTGVEVADRIKSDHPDCLILALSGVGPDEKLLELDVDDYLQKPVKRTELVRRLGDLIVRAELTRAEREYLAVHSKQRALVDTYGEAAERMDVYRELAERKSEVDLSPNQKEILKFTAIG